jgi:hypothetical protein
VNGTAHRFACGLVGLSVGVAACAEDGPGVQTASTVEPPRTVDTSYAPDLPAPAYGPGSGPTICADETRNNFHALDGTYLPFARVLDRDGYEVRVLGEGGAALEACDLLVIADAQPPEHPGDPPTFPAEDVAAIHSWVVAGGSLFLITDHQPDPSAVQALSASFGVELHNGYVFDGPPGEAGGPMVFRRGDGTLADDPLLDARGPEGEVTEVATFLGSALRGGPKFRPLLLFGSGVLSWAPERYYEFEPDTPRVDVSGWSQGGVMEYEAGRVAVFGEAAMFTAQVFDQGRIRVGMNAPEATHNLQLLLNVVHWLSRLEDERPG